MSGMAFDTLKTAKTLAEAGFPATQAEALSSAMATAVSGHVATKEDIATLSGKIDSAVTRLDGKIDSAVTRLDAKIDAVRNDLSAQIQLLKWMVGVVVALNLAILARVLLG